MESPEQPDDAPGGEAQEAGRAADAEESRAGAVSQDMESGLRDMKQRAQELKEDVEDAREDWQRKRQDPSVPGAPPPDEGD